MDTVEVHHVDLRRAVGPPGAGIAFPFSVIRAKVEGVTNLQQRGIAEECACPLLQPVKRQSPMGRRHTVGTVHLIMEAVLAPEERWANTDMGVVGRAIRGSAFRCGFSRTPARIEIFEVDGVELIVENE